jgi:uncharacterized protein YndB with AHSA1/START domain
VDANQNAPVFARHEIHIEAQPERVWALISDIDRWGSWQPDIPTAKLIGPLAPGSTFKWKSGNTGVSSTLEEVDPPRRLGWSGRSLGARAKHVWTLEPQVSGTTVRTQESFEGLVVVLLKSRMQRLLDDSLQKWLAALKGLRSSRRVAPDKRIGRTPRCGGQETEKGPVVGD